MAAQWRGDPRSRTPSTGNTARPIAASANGKSTNTGRLNAVTASRNPSQANRLVLPVCSARSATSIEAVNISVVQTSVITSAEKYGIGGYSATTAAAARPIASEATSLPIANTTPQITTKSAV